MLTFAQKSNIRRHLDYPVAGLLSASAAGGSLASAFVGYRFLQTYGRLEWKLNNLNPDEEARLTGLAYGAVALVGPQPNPGDQIGITLSGGGLSTPQTITATMPTVPVGTDGRPQFILALAAAAAANTALQQARFQCPSTLRHWSVQHEPVAIGGGGVHRPRSVHARQPHGFRCPIPPNHRHRGVLNTLHLARWHNDPLRLSPHS